MTQNGDFSIVQCLMVNIPLACRVIVDHERELSYTFHVKYAIKSPIMAVLSFIPCAG